MPSTTTRTAREGAMPFRRLLRDAAVHWLAGLALLAGSLAALYPAIGVSAPGYAWAAAAYLATGAMIAVFLPQHAPHRTFGLANRLTLTRGLIAAFLAGFVAQPALIDETGWLLIAAALVSLILDGLDGFAARRTGLSSAFGARFDMETDSLLILILSVLAWSTGKIGAWILLAGALRYLFLAAGLVLPWLRTALPSSKRRQTVCVVQVVALFLLLVPFLPAWGANVIGAAAVASLLWSFAIDVAWLWRNARNA